MSRSSRLVGAGSAIVLAVTAGLGLGVGMAGPALADSSFQAFEGSADLQNPYHVIVVDEGGATNVACAEEFSRWMRSEPVQQTIADFGVENYGQPLFFPDAPS